jgi:uncharacterized metal-binding protein YceD (DUF177 family)
MKALQQFNIPFIGMANKIHQLEFSVDGSFFDCFEDAPISKCAVDVKIDFDKRENFFHLKFYIDGSVNVECDRCSEPFDLGIFGDYELFVKFGNETIEDSEDDVIFISKNDDHVDLSKSVYDYILLSIPLKCVHPDNEDGEPGCNKEVLEKLYKKEEQTVDPRWAALEKLKNKKD